MDASRTIKAEDLLARLRAGGVNITRDQLRRWHSEGLIPRPDQNQFPQAHGSESLYPAGTFEQARRLHELLETSRSFERAGWRLWTEGYPVDERYWLPVLKRAAGHLALMARFARFLRHRDERDMDGNIDREPTHVRAASERVAVPPLNLTWFRATKDERARFLRLVLSIASGDADEVTHHDEAENEYDERAFLKLAGAQQNRPDTVHGNALTFHRSVPQVLRALASATTAVPSSDAITRASSSCLRGACEYLHEARKLVLSLYQSSSWVFGKGAFGLRLLHRFVERTEPTWEAAALLMWPTSSSALGNEVYSVGELRGMRVDSERTLETVRKLQALARTPRFQDVLRPEKMRSAFRKNAAFHAFLRELQAARDAP